MEFPKAPTPSEVKDAADEVLDDGVDAAEEIVETVVAAVQNAADDAGGAAADAAKAAHDVMMSGARKAAAITNVVEGFVDGVFDIAAGNIGDAAAHVEHALAATTTVLIVFLGDMLGMRGVGSRIQNTLQRVRVVVDRGLQWGANRGVGVAGDARERLLPYANALRDLAQHAGSQAEHSRTQVIQILERLKAQARPQKKGQPSKQAAVSEPADVKRTEAMLARLARLERSLHKLEMAMLRKGARYTKETAAVAKLRNGISTQRKHLSMRLVPRTVQPQMKPPPGLARR